MPARESTVKSGAGPRFIAPTRADAVLFVQSLSQWFRASARDLPWRRIHDPYGIWISEAMLQQTRVEVVEDYWPRFLERFPDLKSLAGADEECVLEAWSGLGYYSRARALRAAAQLIVDDHDGRFPRDRSAALALPGVGPYTAGAVLSIAYDLPEALVDGNVERVFARLFALDGVKASSELGRAAWEAARYFVGIVGERSVGIGPGLWNQALMELGALVCTPRAPRCATCCVRSHCAAFKADRAGEFPRPRSRKQLIDVTLETYVVRDGDAVLLIRRPEAGRMAGMWEFPTLELSGTGLFPSELPGELGPRLEPGFELFTLSHGITHHRIRIQVRAASVSNFDSLDDPAAGRAIVSLEDARGLALTGMARKALGRLDASEGSLFE